MTDARPTSEHVVHPLGEPAPESPQGQPPIIRRAELVAFSLIALTVISVLAVLYVARAFFLPIVAAFVIGTMLSPAAKFLERYRIPRPISAVLIVSAFMLASSLGGLGQKVAAVGELGRKALFVVRMLDRLACQRRDHRRQLHLALIVGGARDTNGRRRADPARLAERR